MHDYIPQNNTYLVFKSSDSHLFTICKLLTNFSILLKWFVTIIYQQVLVISTQFGFHARQSHTVATQNLASYYEIVDDLVGSVFIDLSMAFDSQY